MPEVVLKHKDDLTPLDKMDIWVRVAPAIANELTCDDPDGHLSRDDIMMFFSRMEEGEACAFDLYFRVEALTYPSRGKDIKERTLRLRDRLQRCFPDKKIGVWVKLSDGYWAETDEASTDRG